MFRTLGSVLLIAALSSCGFTRDISPFSERQLWRVAGGDGAVTVGADVGTGWLEVTSSDSDRSGPPRSAPPRPGSFGPKPHQTYANKHLLFGAVTVLLRQDTTPLLMLDGTDHSGSVVWSAGRPGEVYTCTFDLVPQARTLSGQFVKVVGGQPVSLGSCTVSRLS